MLSRIRIWATSSLLSALSLAGILLAEVPVVSANDRSIVDDRRTGATVMSTLDADTLPSPGIAIGITSWDLQHNYAQGHQVASNPGSETVHFAWTMWDVIPESYEATNRFVNYNSWDKPSGTTNQGFNGSCVSLGEFARGGMVRVDVDGDNLCHATLNQRIEDGFPYKAWHLLFPIEGSALHLDRELADSLIPWIDGTIWPDIAVEQRQAGGEIYHVIAMGGTVYNYLDPDWRIWYWRYDAGAPAPTWEGPVVIDSTWGIGYVIDAADDSGKVAISFHSRWLEDGLNGLENIAYHESFTAGLGWLNGFELGPATRNLITSYSEEGGPEAWTETSIAYDHRGVLHIVYTEQREPGSEDIALKHWSNERGTSTTVAEAYYDNPDIWSRLANLGQISLGVGDGATWCKGGTETNRDYLYVLYTQLGGPTPEEQSDVSVRGWANGELYLTASTSHGDIWSPPINLTNTKTPDCNSDHPDSTCASEAWGTIARDVSDIEILYVRDYEAEYFGYSGWTMNKIMYLNLPGGTTDAEFVCPLIAPRFSADITADATCEYHAAPGGLNPETLTIVNSGSDDLTGDISVTAGAVWLSVAGSVPPYTVFVGADPLQKTVTMDATGLTEGLYFGEIQITHNDTSQASPRIFPIVFYVLDEFYCPEDMILRTAVASPGVLSLQIGSDGRFGAPADDGGLWRYLDSSSAINDATLLVAHGSQDPDTIVFHKFYTRNDPGQHGFRSVAELEVDTSAYGTGTGFASASAQMTTSDSTLGIEAAWHFPQHPDSADFVIVEYVVTNRTASPVTDIAVGLYADLDVLAAAHMQVVQEHHKANHGYFVADWNLIYQYGYDSIGHVPSEYLNSTERYSAGFTYIAGRRYATDGLPFENEPVPLRGCVGDNRDNLSDDGPSSGFLYTTVTGLTGVTVWAPYNHEDSAKDQYTALTLDQGLTLEPGQRQVYIVGCVSDTLAHSQYSPPPVKSFGASSLEDVTQRAWEWAAANVVCRCDCGADPQCDGALDILDVVRAVDVAFRDQPPVIEHPCPVPRTDVTCDGVTDVLDVVRFVEVAFRDGDPATLFCDPCAP